MLVTIESNESLVEKVALKNADKNSKPLPPPFDADASMNTNNVSPLLPETLQKPFDDDEGEHEKPTTTPPSQKPFFIMDFLEQVDPKDVKLAQDMLLQTPAKNKASPSNDTKSTRRSQQSHCSSSPLKPVCKDLFSLPTTTTTSQTMSNKKKNQPSSSFLKRSIAIGNGYNAKGIAKARQGAWEDALACWENALEIREQVLGEQHLDVANTCNNIGIALGKLKQTDTAVLYLDRALEIRKQHPHQDAQVAATLHNIGNVFQQAGDMATAIQYFCECKMLQEEIHGGTNHVEVARACVAIGHSFYQAHCLIDAREAYLDAADIFHRLQEKQQEADGGDTNPELQAILQDIQELDERILYDFKARSQQQQQQQQNKASFS